MTDEHHQAAAAVGMAVRVALVILTVHDQQLDVLLTEVREPGTWPGSAGGRPRLPNRPLAGDLPQAAGNVLHATTGLDPDAVYLDQLGAYTTTPARDDADGHELIVAYLAITPGHLAPDYGEDAAAAGWRPAHPAAAEPGRMADGHHPILTDGLARTAALLERTPLATRFCPEPFTIADLRAVYEAVWNTRLDHRNFHRKISKTEGLVIPTGQKRTDTGRPAELYHRGPAEQLAPPIQPPQ